MKVLLTNYYGFGAGGAEKSTFLTAKALEEAGHDVVVASTGDFPRLEVRKFKKFLLPLPFFQKHYLKNFLKKIILKEKIQLVHSQDRLTDFAGILAAREAGVPAVAHFRDYWFACNKSTCLQENMRKCSVCNFFQLQRCVPLRRLPWEYIKMKALQGNMKILGWADAKIAISNAVKQKLALCGIKENVFVVPNPVDVKAFEKVEKIGLRQKYGLKEKIVLFVGRFSYEKGVMNLLHVAEKILRTEKNVSFLFVGDGPMKKEAEEFVKKHNLEGDAVFAGNIPFEKIPLYYKAADVVAVPSIMEGFGRTAAEAFACRKPVVANDVDGLKDVVDHNVNGFLVLPYDFEAWGKKLLDLLQMDSLRKRMGNNAYQKAVSEFDSQAVAEKLVKIYKSVMQ